MTARPNLVNLILAAVLLVGGAWGFLHLMADLPTGWGLVFWAPLIGGSVGVGFCLASNEARS